MKFEGFAFLKESLTLIRQTLYSCFKKMLELHFLINIQKEYVRLRVVMISLNATNFLLTQTTNKKKRKLVK